MFIKLNDEELLNTTEVTTIKVNEFDENQLVYWFADGSFKKENFDEATEVTEKIEEISTNNLLFVKISEKILVNARFIKSLKQDVINPLRLVIEIYNGAPVKEKYESTNLVESKKQEFETALLKIKEMISNTDEESIILEEEGEEEIKG